MASSAALAHTRQSLSTCCCIPWFYLLIQLALAAPLLSDMPTTNLARLAVNANG